MAPDARPRPPARVSLVAALGVLAAVGLLGAVLLNVALGARYGFSPWHQLRGSRLELSLAGLAFVLALGVWRGANWARVLGLVAAVALVVQGAGFYALARAFQHPGSAPPLLILLAFLAPAGLVAWALLSRPGRAHFHAP